MKKVTEEKADSISRIIAFLIDWFIGGFIAAVPAVMMCAVLIGSKTVFSDLYSFQVVGIASIWIYITGILCVLTGIVYYVAVPWLLYPGQTLGMHFMHIQIVRRFDKRLTLGILLLRQGGFLIVLCSATASSAYLRQLVSLFLGCDADFLWLFIGNILLVFSAMLMICNPSGRTLHDWCFSTQVVKKGLI